MNAKAAKRLRREMRVLLRIDPRECMYEAMTWPNGHKTIRLRAGCGRHLYREAKRQTWEFSGHSV